MSLAEIEAKPIGSGGPLEVVEESVPGERGSVRSTPKRSAPTVPETLVPHEVPRNAENAPAEE